MKIKKRFLIPIVVLCFLFFATVFRWETVASRTTESAAVKWVRDRWTGQYWVRAYSLPQNGKAVLLEVPLEHRVIVDTQSPVWEAKNTVEAGAGVLVYVCLLWLLGAAIIRPRQKTRERSVANNE